MAEQFSQMDKIIDGLYLGNIQGASNYAQLKKKGITHILQVAAGFKPFFPGEFQYNVINILDMPFENIMKHFKPAVDWIKSAIRSGGTVFVHCFAGISRSASVVIAYLMKELGLPMLDAMTYTRKKRPIVFPNPGFQRQLFEFEKHLRQNNQRAMQEYQDKKKKKIQDTFGVQSRQSGSAFLEQEKIIRLAQESKKMAEIAPIRSPQPQSSNNEESTKNKLKHLVMLANSNNKSAGQNGNFAPISHSSTINSNALGKLLAQAHGSLHSSETGRPMTQHYLQRNHQEVGDKKERKSQPINNNSKYHQNQQQNGPGESLSNPSDIKIKKMLSSQENILTRPPPHDEKKVMSATVKPSPNHNSNPLGLGMGFNILESSYKRDFSLKPLDQANQLNVRKQNYHLTPQKKIDHTPLDHKGIQEQRSTTLIQKNNEHGQQRDTKPTQPQPQAVSQQYFYPSQAQQYQQHAAQKIASSSRVIADKQQQQRGDSMNRVIDAYQKPPMQSSKRTEKAPLPNAFMKNEPVHFFTNKGDQLRVKDERMHHPMSLRSPQPQNDYLLFEKRPHHRDDPRNDQHLLSTKTGTAASGQSALHYPGMLSFDNRGTYQQPNIRDLSNRRRI